MVRLKEYGASDGRLVIYFHGAPGGTSECEALHPQLQKQRLRLVCIDRFSLEPSLQGERYYLSLAEEVKRIAAGQSLTVVGFSIGAFVALQTCRHLDGQVTSLHLISAAAPLQDDSFLKRMAGGTVFRLARRAPSIFALLTRWQGFLARMAPATLFRLIFASAVAQDKVVAADPAFQTIMRGVFRKSFVEGINGYVRDVMAYVEPWASTIHDVRVPTHIWHGELDNWSPPEMATYLADELPAHAGSTVLAGLSHYSCLYDVMSSLHKNLDVMDRASMCAAGQLTANQQDLRLKFIADRAVSVPQKKMGAGSRAAS